MRAKDFLLQIEKLTAMIRNKQIEVRQLKDMAESTTADMAGERVQSTGNPQRFADAIGRYVDLEAELNHDIDALVAKKKEVIGVIEQLNATEYDVLHRIYVQGQTLQEVASAKDRTYSWATTTHGQALKSVQRIIDKQKVC
jgi:hypothetical protein